MSEYEDRYPDAYGRGEEIDPAPGRRHSHGLGLPRQMRGNIPAVVLRGADTPSVKAVNIDESIARSNQRPLQSAPVERSRRPPIDRPPREICDDVAVQIASSPFIDASGVSVTVEGSEVTLDGTINSLIAIALAKALASNVPGVSSVQVQLQIRQAPRSYETARTALPE